MLFVWMIPGTVRAQSTPVVTIDSDLVLSVNGKKVFGMTVSPGPPVNAKSYTGGDALDELRSGGILFYRAPFTSVWKQNGTNLNATMVSTNQTILSWCGQHSVFALLNLNDVSYFTSTDTNTPALLQSVVNTFKGNPGLGMWKNKDEAWWGHTSAADLQRGYDLIHLLDTNHPVEQTHAPRGTVSDLQPYNVTADILMVDNYPIVGAGSASNPPITNTAVSQFGDWTKELSQVANGEREFWMVEQIAFSGTTPPNPLVFPTYTQERFMTYEAIVNGARGLMFFGGNIASTLTNANDAALGWNWTFWTNILKPLTLQLTDGSPLFDALLVPESALPLTLSGASYPDIEFCVREAGTNLFVLATKREGATVNATFNGLPAWATNATVLFESNRIVSATNGAITDSFVQWDAHAYRFSYRGSVPAFTFQPHSRTNLAGTTAIFSASAVSPTALTYQWRKNGAPLSTGGNVSGATSPNLTLSNVSLSDAASYDVVVTGSISLTSSPPAMLTIVTDSPPTILTQPISKTNFMGTEVSFTVTATNVGGGSFQWRRNGVNLADSAAIFGATSSALTISPIAVTDAGSYSVVINNSVGGVTSSDAVLTVVVPPSTTNWIAMWTATPGISPWVTSNGGPNTPNERTIAYNALSNQLYVVQRNSAGSSQVSIYVLNAATGGFLYKLNTNGYSFTGNIPLCGIAVADDGAIYACNNDTAGTGLPTWKIYRWANSNPATLPQLIYSGDPLGGVNARWGDALDARGSGTNTVLLGDNHQPNASNPSLNPVICLLQPTDATMNTFTNKLCALDNTNNPSFNSSVIGHSLNFDTTGTNILQKHFAQALAKNSYRPSATNGAAATFVTNYTNFPSTVGPVDLMAQSNLLAALNFSGIGGSSPDMLELYSVTNLNTPMLLCSAPFPVNANTNVNRIGQVIISSNYVFALDANNGLLAFRLRGPIAPGLLLQPQNQTVVSNDSASFFAVAQGTDPLTYQWKQNGTNIPGASTNTLALTATQPGDAGTYTVIISNAFGSVTSADAILAVNIPPGIFSQPTNQSVISGHAFGFSVNAGGTVPLAYQWFHNDVPIADATASSYGWPNAQLSDVGNYFVVVTNVVGLVTSWEVELIVNVPPQIDHILTQPGGFTLQFNGTAGLSYDLQSSTNLIDWMVATNLTADTNGQFGFSTTFATNTPFQFFRLSR